MSSSKAPIRLAIVGVGKIVRDQHLPALARDASYHLVAAASRNATVEGVANFATIEEMLASDVVIDAVSLCQPPLVRYEAARAALEAGKHVFLEKPPGATVSEVEDLKALAARKGVSLFASWHSRYAPAVEGARAFLAGTVARKARFIWKEDVRKWHPGQAWIWEAGGFGVFDPFINCLSIVTHILPPLYITRATLDFPENRDTPVAARMDFAGANGLAASAEIDWLQTGPQSWDIIVETDAGELLLSSGGAKLAISGQPVKDEAEREYPALYERFAHLVRAGKSDVDVAPLRHVADAFMLGRRNVVEAFFD
ncbi:MAG: Gfo/Idh/MocA family oxidoreductase [Hyphomicrobiales bacterium]|nr:Gfo/Idh/MocA family oxidoreductase [Hyphomicrobiales bacterium]